MHRYSGRLPVPIVLSPLIAAAAWLALSTTGALAYTVGPASLATAPAVDTPGVPFTVTATFIGNDGVPDANQPVVFTSSSFTTAAAPMRPGGMVLMAHLSRPAQSRVCSVSFNPTTTTTNAAGTATTTATIPTGCFGTFTITATIPGVGSVSVTVRSTGANAAAGFPNTSTQGGPARTATAEPALIAGSLLVLSVVLAVLWLRVRARRTSS